MTAIVDVDTHELVEELRRNVIGEVRFDKVTRLLYSTDASIYQVEPIGVVLPKTAEDVIAVVEIANRHSVPVLPRGGGTSLAGQTVGQAIVIDFSKHMRDVIDINPEEGWARVQPGIILDELNARLRPSGYQFAPDPSTSNRSNVGGALGNNSCGSHSIVWGKTVDNVQSMEVVLSNGDVATFGPLTETGLEAKSRQDNFEGEIYRGLLNIGEANRDEIMSRYPKIQRRVSGYNLDEFVGDQLFDMARFAVGSEGTLLTITEADLRIVPVAKHKGIAVLHFSELIESMEATVAILGLQPAAVEHIGSMILNQARSNLAYSRQMDFIDGNPDSLLVVEFTGESATEVDSKLEECRRLVEQARLGYSVKKLVTPDDQAKPWAVRKAGLGLMMNVPGDAKPLPFVEDTAVAPEKLPEFVRRFDEIVRSHGTEAGYYGHASVGCLHIRPLINLKLQTDIEKMVTIGEEISDLVLEFKGSMSGEHGDGLVRSVWHEKMFGPVLYEAFRQVKKTFDPKNIMNPGKIVESPPITENLRINSSYTPVEIETGFSFSREGGFTQALEMCNGQGACRKLDGTMCPSYMVTRDEEHTTRARANVLRSAISGALPIDSLASSRLNEVFDLCLECKGCKAECPSNVDVAKLKYEFSYRHRQSNGYSLRDHMLANASILGKIGSFFAPLSNWTLRHSAVKGLLRDHVGIDARRDMPAYASQTFSQWNRARGQTPDRGRGTVVLFPDTFMNYNKPYMGKAAVKVIEHLGYNVIVPNPICCGRPMLSKGMLDKAKDNARKNVAAVLPYVEAGAKLVGIEPSCILSFRDDYVDLLDDDASALVSKNTMLIEEFVIHATDDDGAELKFRNSPGQILFHGHCHQKALVGTSKAMRLLKLIPGCEPTEIQSGCCGMAGSFGFEVEHYDLSMKIGEHSLFKPIRSQQGEFTVVTEGESCRHQILDGTGVKAKHLVEVLADAL